MSRNLAKFRLPLIASMLLVIPFILMELVNRWTFNEGFPFSLLGFMGAVALAFGFGQTAFVRQLRTGKKGLGTILLLVLLLVVIGLSIWSFTHLLADQMPCFLGVPNCD